jgi:hypothetical protein
MKKERKKENRGKLHTKIGNMSTMKYIEKTRKRISAY